MVKSYEARREAERKKKLQIFAKEFFEALEVLTLIFLVVGSLWASFLLVLFGMAFGESRILFGALAPIVSVTLFSYCYWKIFENK